METLTLRIPRNWVGHVNAAQVRAWIAKYTFNPAILPPARVSLEARVSWRLPLELVRDMARKLVCSPGELVRRVVAAGLRSTAQRTDAPVHQAPVVEKRKPEGVVAHRSNLVNVLDPHRIVSEEIFGEDGNGCVVIVQRDAQGLGFMRTLTISREAYLRLRRS